MRWLTRLGLAILAVTFTLPALAQSWPDKPVKIVVPFGPGGPADVYARILGQALTEQLGQQFIIDNKPGAGAIIGTEVVAKAAPDGYTLLMMSNTHTTNETLFTHKPYQLMRDLVPDGADDLGAQQLTVPTEVPFEGVLVDDDVVAEVVAGDGVTDVVAVGPVLVAAAGDHDRDLFDHLEEVLGQGVDRVDDVLLELARLALVGRHRGECLTALDDPPELLLRHLAATEQGRRPRREEDEDDSSRDQHRHPGADVGAREPLAVEPRRPAHDDAVRVADDYPRAHRDKLVHEEKAILEHLLEDKHRPPRLRRNRDRD